MFLLSSSIFAWDLIIVLMLACFSAVCILCVIRARRSRRKRRISRVVTWLMFSVSLFSFLVIVYGSFIEPQYIVVTRKDVRFPVHDPLTVVVLSDLHVGPYKGERFTKRVVSRVNALLPDLVLIAGDFVLGDTIGPDELAALSPLGELRSTLGTVAVLGNHDHDEFRTLMGSSRTRTDNSEYLMAALQSLNIRVLTNEHTILDLGTEQIAIAGVDDLRVSEADLEAALRGIPPDLPTILVSHNPDVVLDTLSAQAELIVAGHTHGGQVRLPFIGPVIALPTRLGKRYDQGTFAIDEDSTLAITRGVGESGARARLLAWPEVMVLKLSSSHGS